MLVGEQRAPFPGAASRLSAASSSLQHPPPSADPPVPFAPNISQILPLPPYHESILEYIVANKHIGRSEREILVLGYGYYRFQNPPYMASRMLPIAHIAATGTSLSPLPCHALRDYKVTSAHRVEVEVGADAARKGGPLTT
jgi:hypothetical protein